MGAQVSCHHLCLERLVKTGAEALPRCLQAWAACVRPRGPLGLPLQALVQPHLRRVRMQRQEKSMQTAPLANARMAAWLAALAAAGSSRSSGVCCGSSAAACCSSAGCAEVSKPSRKRQLSTQPRPPPKLARRSSTAAASRRRAKLAGRALCQAATHSSAAP